MWRGTVQCLTVTAHANQELWSDDFRAMARAGKLTTRTVCDFASWIVLSSTLFCACLRGGDWWKLTKAGVREFINGEQREDGGVTIATSAFKTQGVYKYEAIPLDKNMRTIWRFYDKHCRKVVDPDDSGKYFFLSLRGKKEKK